MEYQDYELQRSEYYERDLEKAQSALTSRRNALVEAGFSAYEEIQELEIGGFIGLNREYGAEEGPAIDRRIWAKEKLELAESRLEAAESVDLGEMVKRHIWIRWFQEQVDAARTRLDAVPAYRGGDYLSGGKYYVREGENERERQEKTEAACTRRWEDERKAMGLLRLARHGLEAARSDEFAEKIERAVLVNMVQQELQSARIKFEKEKTSLERIREKGRVLSALGWIVSTKRKMEQHQVLLKWIEQQRREIISGCTSTEDSGYGSSKRASSRALSARLTMGTSRRSGPLQANGRKSRGPTERSILKPVHTSKVTKTTCKRGSPRQRTKTSYSALLPSLCSVRRSRSSRPSKKQPDRQRGNGAKLPQRGNGLAISSPPSTSRKTVQQSAKPPLRRSTRISKQPERFRPG